MARKVVGVGSVGTRAWVILLVGREGKDPLVLQAKEAQASVLEPHLGASEFECQGERVVRGQRISQAASDIFLGWLRSEGLDGQEYDFYVRQLWDWKASADLSTLERGGPAAPTRAPAAGRSRAHTPAPATGSRSPPISAAVRASIERSRASQPPTPTRTSATTSGSPTRSPPARSQPPTASELVTAEALECSRRLAPACGGPTCPPARRTQSQHRRTRTAT